MLTSFEAMRIAVDTGIDEDRIKSLLGIAETPQECREVIKRQPFRCNEATIRALRKLILQENHLGGLYDAWRLSGLEKWPNQQKEKLEPLLKEKIEGLIAEQVKASNDLATIARLAEKLPGELDLKFFFKITGIIWTRCEELVTAQVTAAKNIAEIKQVTQNAPGPRLKELAARKWIEFITTAEALNDFARLRTLSEKPSIV